jgi:DNA-binding NtrC family response regulator
MGGPALVDQIHGRQPEVKAILTTACGGAVEYLEATRSRDVDYLLKPLDLPQLLGLIETAIGRPVEMPSDYWLC